MMMMIIIILGWLREGCRGTFCKQVLFFSLHQRAEPLEEK